MSASSEISLAPNMIRLASGKLTPEPICVRTMTGTRMIAGEIAGFFEMGFASGLNGTAAEAIGYLIFTQHGCHPLNIALRGSGEHDALFGGHQVSSCSTRAGIEPWKRSVGRELTAISPSVIVFFEHVDGAELIEVEAGMRLEEALKDFGTKIDVFRADE